MHMVVFVSGYSKRKVSSYDRLFYCAIWECWPVLKSSGSLSFEEISLSFEQNCLSLGHVFLSFEQNSLSFGAISSSLMLIFS